MVGTILTFDGYTESQRRIHQRYPEGSENPFSLALFEEQYRDAGYRLTIKKAGDVCATGDRTKFVWSCLVPDDPNANLVSSRRPSPVEIVCRELTMH